jgi:uncharacterized protein (DUF433 family)
MSLEGTVQNGVIVPDADALPLPDGTRVEYAPRTGMEPAINKTPGVVGGDACIRRTRIPVWLLVSLRELGADDAKLLEAYPTLTPADLAEAWKYHAAHPDEIARAIQEQEVTEHNEQPKPHVWKCVEAVF